MSTPKKTSPKRSVKAPGPAPIGYSTDPAHSILLARLEQLKEFLDAALKPKSAHPSDPALSAGLGRLSTIEDKVDRLAVQVDSILKRLKSPNPNDPALFVGPEKGAARPSRPPVSAADPDRSAASAPPAGGDNAQFLARTPLFAKLSALECGLFAQYLEPKALASGAVLFKQDDFGDAMYVVKSGVLEIYKNDVFGPVRVAEVRPGGLVGEMALVENKPRSANVRASEDSSLLLLSRGAYAQLKEVHPQVATKFQDELLLLLSGRLRQTTERLVGKD